MCCVGVSYWVVGGALELDMLFVHRKKMVRKTEKQRHQNGENGCVAPELLNLSVVLACSFLGINYY